jgi:hypothetical protein
LFLLPAAAGRRRPYEKNLPFHTPDELAAVGAGMPGGFSTDEYLHLVDFMVEYAMKPGYDFGNEFLYGLDLILDGLDRALSNSRR